MSTPIDSTNNSTSPTPTTPINPYAPYLQYNPLTNEPFIRLPPPHQNIIITPARLTARTVTLPDGSIRSILADVDAVPPILSDPRVHRTLSGPPVPYTKEHAAEWLGRRSEESRRVLDEIERAVRRRREAGEGQNGTTNENEGVPPVSGCPVHCVRIVHEDGSDEFIGDISLVRSSFFEVSNLEARQRAVDENNARRFGGDEEIVWMFGDYLHPSYHSRGIMSLAIRTILHTYAIPFMHVRYIKVNAHEDNPASARVFVKNGFREVGVVGGGGKEGAGVWVGKERRKEYEGLEGGGKWVGLRVLEWRFEGGDGNGKEAT